MRLSFDSSVKQRQLLILQKKEKKLKKKKAVCPFLNMVV